MVDLVVLVLVTELLVQVLLGKAIMEPHLPLVEQQIQLAEVAVLEQLGAFPEAQLAVTVALVYSHLLQVLLFIMLAAAAVELFLAPERRVLVVLVGVVTEVNMMVLRELQTLAAVVVVAPALMAELEDLEW
jgi:hypothetical protein